MIIYDTATGNIVFSSNAPATDGYITNNLALHPGAEVLRDEFVYSPEFYYVSEDGNILQRPEKPDEAAVWADRKWVIDTIEKERLIRLKRDGLLAESDWTQRPDVALPPRDAWATYRQALRDLPEQPGFPLEVGWPVRPGG
jgi:hypothetical protein